MLWQSTISKFQGLTWEMFIFHSCEMRCEPRQLSKPVVLYQASQASLNFGLSTLELSGSLNYVKSHPQSWQQMKRGDRLTTMTIKHFDTEFTPICIAHWLARTSGPATSNCKGEGGQPSVPSEREDPVRVNTRCLYYSTVYSTSSLKQVLYIFLTFVCPRGLNGNCNN